MNSYMPTNWTTGRNGYIPRNTQSSKTESESNRKSEQTSNYQRHQISEEKLPTKPWVDSSRGEFYQILKEELIPILLKPFKNN